MNLNGLHRDLRSSVTDIVGIPWIRHELVSMPFSESEYDYVNNYYVRRKELSEELFENKKWAMYLTMHEVPWHVEAFSRIHRYLEDEEYWKILASIYMASENLWQNKRAWKMFLSSERPGREHFMTEAERKFLAELPESFTIYRGYMKGLNKSGFSYSLSENTAIWFSKRYLGLELDSSQVHKRTIKKKNVFAYLSRADESEIIVIE
ncbi:MAG: hypothetical protein EOP06_03070 [Proteobacteria bacterium]|nr:MAG: hypothetical protein EOP06_03070 [Pseudomonadota bacterium]